MNHIHKKAIILFNQSGNSTVSQYLINHHIQYIAPHQISKLIHNRNNSLNKARNIPSILSRVSGFSWIFNHKWTHRATATIIHIKARNVIIKRVVSKSPLFYFYLIVCQYFCSSGNISRSYSFFYNIQSCIFYWIRDTLNGCIYSLFYYSLSNSRIISFLY